LGRWLEVGSSFASEDPILPGETDASPRERYYYFLGDLEAMREGRWKLRLAGDTTQLFDLRTDPAERFNRADGRPDLVQEMRAQMKTFADSVGTEVPGE